VRAPKAWAPQKALADLYKKPSAGTTSSDMKEAVGSYGVSRGPVRAEEMIGSIAISD
jgi:hypothetical protein